MRLAIVYISHTHTAMEVVGVGDETSERLRDYVRSVT